VTPCALAEAPHLVCMGSYWLPVRAQDAAAATTHWFRLSAYVDLVRGHERVVLSYGASTATPVLLRFQRERCSSAFPGGGSERSSGAGRRRSARSPRTARASR
jgi:ABC-type thiamine transport system substrate-binding protein